MVWEEIGTLPSSKSVSLAIPQSISSARGYSCQVIVVTRECDYSLYGHYYCVDS